MTRVLVVEDEESYSDALAYMLRKEGFEVALAATGPDALAEFDRNGADIVLLDLMLPGLPGTEVCRQIRQTSNVPVIMVSAKDDEVDKVVGLELGADDYVTKPYSPRELVARIRAVLRRGTEPDLAPMTLEAGSVRMDVERHVVTVDGEPQRLPLKEFELLEMFLRNPGRVLTRGQLIDRVWGSDYVGDTKTLDVHVKRLRAKLEPDPAAPDAAWSPCAGWATSSTSEGRRVHALVGPEAAVRRITLASVLRDGEGAIMRRLGEMVLRHRLLVVVAWVVIAVAGGAVASTVNGRTTVNFSLPGQPGDTAANKIVAAFHNGGNTTPLLVTVTMPQGQTVTGHEAEVAKAFASVGSMSVPLRVVDEANTGDKAFRTSDDQTAYAMVFYPFPQSLGAVLPTKAVQDSVQSAAPSAAVVGVTGMDALAVGDSSGGNGVLTETLLGALGALAVLLFVFASLLAFMPLVVAAVSILTTFLLLLPLTYFTDVSFIVMFLISLVGLGVAIDYSLLFVTRWREERDHGRDNHDAVIAAMETAGHAVLFSGLTVAIGLLALVVLPVPFMRSIGMAGALIPLASVMVTLTLTPAILGSIGPKVDWPKIRHENKASKGWTAWARMIVRHRWVAAIAALAVIGVLFVAFLGIKIGAADSSSLAQSGPAYDTLQVLKNGGITTGALTPIEVLSETDKADSVARTLGGVDGVTAAVVPTGAGSSVDGETVVVLIPNEETVNSKSVQVVRDVTALGGPDRRRDRGDRSRQRAGRLPARRLRQLPAGAADHRGAHLRPAGARVPIVAAAAEGGDPQPGLADRRLRPDRAVLAGGLRLERVLRHRGDRSGHLLDPADGLRVPLRPVDGLRGVHPVPDPGGVRRRTRPPTRRSSSASVAPAAW